MADLGSEEQPVRSAISRLKRRGVLLSENRRGVAGYSLSSATLGVLAEGDIRIFERSRASLQDGWLLAAFTVPESERENRHALRSCLTQLGFGTASPGLWIAPATLLSEAQHTLDRRGLADYVDLFIGQYATARDLRDEVQSWWDLQELAAMYTDFIARATITRADSPGLTPERAFREYVPILTAWRRLPYLDPGLPLELLPAGWIGVTAAALFDDLDRDLRPLAQAHVAKVLGGSQPGGRAASS